MTIRSNKFRFTALLSVILTITSVPSPTIQPTPDSRSFGDRNPNETKLARIQAGVSNLTLPTIFEINRGQADDDVMFIGRSAGFGLLLKSNEVVLSLNSPAESIPATNRDGERKRFTSTLHMRMEGAAHNA